MKNLSPRSSAIAGSLGACIFFCGILSGLVYVYFPIFSLDVRLHHSIGKAIVSFLSIPTYTHQYILIGSVLTLPIPIFLFFPFAETIFARRMLTTLIVCGFFLDFWMIWKTILEYPVKGWIGGGTVGLFFHSFQLYCSWKYLFPPSKDQPGTSEK